MISVLQRVREARVEVDGQVIGQIGHGLLALVCAERGDSQADADKWLAKMLKLRIFQDEAANVNWLTISRPPATSTPRGRCRTLSSRL